MVVLGIVYIAGALDLLFKYANFMTSIIFRALQQCYNDVNNVH